MTAIEMIRARMSAPKDNLTPPSDEGGEIVPVEEEKPQIPTTNTLSHLFEMYNRAPEPLDEKKLERKKTWGAIADTLTTLIEMYTIGKGGLVRPRSASALANAENEEKDIRELYRQQMNEHNAGRAKAAMQDAINAQREGAAERKKQQNEELKKAERDYGRKKDDRDYRFKTENADRDHRFREEKERNLIADRAARTNAYIKKLENKYRISVEAREDDPNAVAGELGAPVINFELSTGEVDKVVSKAMQDSAFRKKYSGLFQPVIDGFGEDTGGTRITPGLTKGVIAQAYQQYLYDTQQRQQPDPIGPPTEEEYLRTKSSIPALILTEEQEEEIENEEEDEEEDWSLYLID